MHRNNLRNIEVEFLVKSALVLKLIIMSRSWVMEAKAGRIIGSGETFGVPHGDNLLYSGYKWEVITLVFKQNAILLKG